MCLYLVGASALISTQIDLCAAFELNKMVFFSVAGLLFPVFCSYGDAQWWAVLSVQTTESLDFIIIKMALKKYILHG